MVASKRLPRTTPCVKLARKRTKNFTPHHAKTAKESFRPAKLSKYENTDYNHNQLEHRHPGFYRQLLSCEFRCTVVSSRGNYECFFVAWFTSACSWDEKYFEALWRAKMQTKLELQAETKKRATYNAKRYFRWRHSGVRERTRFYMHTTTTNSQELLRYRFNCEWNFPVKIFRK